MAAAEFDDRGRRIEQPGSDGLVRELSSMDELEALLSESAKEGGVVVVKAYGPNCPKCRAAAPKFRDFAAVYEGAITCVAANLSAAKGTYRGLGEPSSVPLFIAYRGGVRMNGGDLAAMESLVDAELLGGLPECDDEEECVIDESWA